MQNVIEKPFSKAVKIKVVFTDKSKVQSFAALSRITLNIGGEDYSTDITPTKLYVDQDDSKTLILDIGSVTQLEKGAYDPEIVCYSATYTNGYPLTSKSVPKIKPIIVY